MVKPKTTTAPKVKPKSSQKNGHVWRLTKDTLDILGKYDSDANEAILKMQGEIDRLRDLHPGETKPSTVTNAHPCQFNPDALKPIIKETMEEVIAPFTGG